MNLKNLFSITAVLLFAGSAQAAILFEDDFESYALGSSINGQGGWVANDSANTYVITTSSYTGSKAVTSGNYVADAAISHTFTEQTGSTIYLGADVDFVPGQANTYFFNLSDAASRASSAGGNFLSTGVRARNFNSAESSQSSGIVSYGDPARIVIEVSVSGTNGSNYDTTTIWSSSNDYASAIATITYSTGISSLDTLYGARGSDTNGNSFIFDNLVIATTFNEAAIPEPSVYASFIGFGVLTLAAVIRRRKTRQA